MTQQWGELVSSLHMTCVLSIPKILSTYACAFPPLQIHASSGRSGPTKVAEMTLHLIAKLSAAVYSALADMCYISVMGGEKCGGAPCRQPDPYCWLLNHLFDCPLSPVSWLCTFRQGASKKSALPWGCNIYLPFLLGRIMLHLSSLAGSDLSLLDVLAYSLVNIKNASRGLVHLVHAMLTLPVWNLRFWGHAEVCWTFPLPMLFLGPRCAKFWGIYTLYSFRLLLLDEVWLSWHPLSPPCACLGVWVSSVLCILTSLVLLYLCYIVHCLFSISSTKFAPPFTHLVRCWGRITDWQNKTGVVSYV